jgi:hypothetical protein
MDAKSQSDPVRLPTRTAKSQTDSEGDGPSRLNSSVYTPRTETSHPDSALEYPAPAARPDDPPPAPAWNQDTEFPEGSVLPASGRQTGFGRHGIHAKDAARMTVVTRREARPVRSIMPSLRC